MLPRDVESATLVGRIFDAEAGGPCVVGVRGDKIVDLTPIEPTMSGLLERQDLVEVVTGAPARREWPLSEVTWLAPCDLQVIKACGVTFVRSMIERVIEERAQGDPKRAGEIRARIEDVVGGMI